MTEEEKKIVALTAQISKLQKQVSLKRNKSQTGTSRGNGSSARHGTQSQGRGRGGRTSSGRSGRGTGRGNSERRFDPWMLKAPGSNEPKTKTMNGKPYNWCPLHKRWVMHKPDQCKLKDQPQQGTAPNQATQQQGGTSPGPELIIDTNLQAIQVFDDQDSVDF